MIRLVATDIDGTLMVRGTTVPERNRAARGAKIFPRTPVPVAAEAMREFSEMYVVPVTPSLVMGAVGHSHRAGISIRDALIVVAALSAGCARLLSEDFREGAEFDGLRMVNPLRA